MVRTPDWLLERRKRAERALATAREILGIGVTTAEDGAAWLTFLRSLTAGGLSGVRLITSDAHAGLINAIGASLPGASWQRCRIQYADVRVMPIRWGYVLVAGVDGLVKSA
jgi:hypothetical protein